MKRPTMLVKALLRDAALDLDLSVERDAQTFARRIKHEGLSFLTIILPSLSDALERGLEAGLLSCPTAFSRHGRLPRFLGGFFSRVFDRNGRLLDNPCPNSIYWIRQLCRFFKKPNKECSEKYNSLAVQHFVDVEGDLRMMTSQIERKDNTLDKVSQVLWSQVFPEIDYTSLVCHHGPGTTADRLLANERYNLKQWNQRSEHSYPSDLHCYPNYGYAVEASGIGEGSEGLGNLDYLELRDELPVRVVLVPKTQLTPRVIAIEPSHMQYMQQSLKDYVYTILEYHPLTKHSIRFTRQDVNQTLAYRSSIDKRLATLDLKDASDRVHLHLVQRIFKNSGILEYLEDARSVHATLPDGRNIVLFKYASMGSALCFPVEAMVFYTLVQSAMHQLDGIRPTSSSIKRYSSLIDIYGDDIIVPVEYADVVVRYLESFALKVNVNKSFRFSNFRESCGADYFNGVAVNPVYAREVPHDDSQAWEAKTVMSWNATADLFYLRGKWTVAQAIRDMLRQVTRRPIPRSQYLGSGLVHYSFLFTTGLRYNSKLHGWKQKRTQYIPVKTKDNIDGNALACLNRWGISTALSERNLHGLFTDLETVRHLVGQLSSPRQQHDLSDRGNAFGDDDRGTPHLRGICSNILAPVCSLSVPSFGGKLTHEEGVEGDPGRPSVCQLDRGTGDMGEVHYFTEAPKSDPLSYLDGRTEGLNFLSSVKRGGFKSTRRWTSLLS